MKKILIIYPQFLPSRTSGGTTRSLLNFVNLFEDDFLFEIHSLKNGEEKYLEVNKSKIKLSTKNKITFFYIYKIIKKNNFDYIYLNSFFSFKYSILPLLICRFLGLTNKLVVAPRGEHLSQALLNKKFKKDIYLQTAKVFKLYNNIKFQATCKEEQERISEILNIKDIFIAADVPYFNKSDKSFKAHNRVEGELKIVFNSRITRTKNFIGLLNSLKTIKGKVELDVYGYFDERESKNYEKECREVIKVLSENIKIKFLGPHYFWEIPYHNYNFFYLPTFGENFCHSIWESILHGCPVLISNKTPWTETVNKYDIGWVEINTECTQFFTNKLNELISYSPSRFNEIQNNTINFAKFFQNDFCKQDYFLLFN